MPSRNSHLSVEEIAGLIDGGLAQNSTRRAMDHVLACSDCAEEYFLGLDLRDREHAGLRADGRSQVARKFQSLIRASHEADAKSGGKTPLLVGLLGLVSGIPRGVPEPALGAHSPILGENDDGGVSSREHRASLQPEDSNAASPPGGTHMSNSTSTFVDAPKIVGDPSTSIVSSEVHQQYDHSCAIQCQRLILNKFGVGVTEAELCDEAAGHGWYDYEHGTRAVDIGKLLEAHGVPVHRYDNANIFNLSSELAQGHKVIVGVDSSDMWRPHPILHEIAEILGMTSADHAVIVSGIDTTDPDHIRVNITDPGTGDVAKSYPLEQFLDAWKESHFVMVSTAEPAPSSLPEMVNFPFAQGHLNLVGHAPYDLVHGLASSVNETTSPDVLHAVEAQYLAAMHGEPVSLDTIDQLGRLHGQDHIQSLFHLLEQPPITIGPSPDHFANWTNTLGLPEGPVSSGIHGMSDPFSVAASHHESQVDSANHPPHQSEDLDGDDTNGDS